MAAATCATEMVEPAAAEPRGLYIALRLSWRDGTPSLGFFVCVISIAAMALAWSKGYTWICEEGGITSHFMHVTHFMHGLVAQGFWSSSGDGVSTHALIGQQRKVDSHIAIWAPGVGDMPLCALPMRACMIGGGASLYA